MREDTQDVDPALDHQQRTDLDNRRLSLLGGFDGPLRLRLRGDGDGRDVEDRGHVLGAAAVDEPRGDVDGAEVPSEGASQWCQSTFRIEGKTSIYNQTSLR